MSIMHCQDCGRFVDTDDEPECFDNPKQICLCEPCRMELEEEDDE